MLQIVLDAVPDMEELFAIMGLQNVQMALRYLRPVSIKVVMLVYHLVIIAFSQTVSLLHLLAVLAV